MSEENNNSPKDKEKKPKNRKFLWIGLGLAVVIISAGLITLFLMKPWSVDSFPIIDDPSNPVAYANQPTRINVNCSDDIGISSAVLSYSTDQIFWSNVTMTGSGTTQWSGYGHIPSYNIERTIYYQIYANDTSNQWTIENRNGFYYSIYTGSRKAILVGSANDFYGDEIPEDGFNGSPDSDFSVGSGNWESNAINMTITPELGLGYMVFTKSGGIGNGIANFTYNWVGHGYNLSDLGEYNISADIEIVESQAINSTRIGLRWTNSTGIARTDWSDYAPTTAGFNQLNVTGACNNETNYEITGLTLIVSVNVTGDIPDGPIAHLDNVKIQKWIAVNSTDPTSQGTSGSNIDADGFPAQTLQIYWILKNQGYTDENIFLMLYHKNDPIIDIYAPWHPMEGTLGPNNTNNLEGAVIDVEDDGVTAARLKLELNTSEGFVSKIQPNDQLIITLTDHGSNAVLPDGNATFHFEADNSYITEVEFFDLVKEIVCSRMMINIDCCFSGNFIQSSPGVYYNVPNAVIVSAAGYTTSWYWISNQNGDGWAGSWFFNQFWEQLSYGIDIMNAFIFATNFVPFGRINPLGITQRPYIHDPNNWGFTWSFVSNPKL